MTSTRGLIAVQQLLVSRIEEEHLGGDAHLVELAELTGEFREEFLGAQVAHDGELA